MHKWLLIFSLVIFSVCVMSACSTETGESQTLRIQSGSNDSSYQGVPHPVRVQTVKITEEQDKRFKQMVIENQKKNQGGQKSEKIRTH